MTNSGQHQSWISKMHMRAASAALTLAVLLGLSPVATQAQTFAVLYSFTGGTDGGNPYAGLIEDRAGNLYGTTTAGGAHGFGTVFEVNPQTGNERVLYSFKGPPDGATPNGGVLINRAANLLYGTTYYGGNGTCNDGNGVGCGTVFKLTRHGARWGEALLYNFVGGVVDGAYPNGGVVLDAAGDLYGTTVMGGAQNLGTIFQLPPNLAENVQHSFRGGNHDGAYPFDSLVFDGNLWGTTLEGGDLNCSSGGCGVVFKLYPCYPNCAVFRLKYIFSGSPADGAGPLADLTEKAGIFWGTTTSGGAGFGTVFRCCGFAYKVLYSFTGPPADGAVPYSGLVQDRFGNLYGTTYYGGASDIGTLFELAHTGVETVLHSFAGTDGESPAGDLIRGSKGILYGTTYYGGDLTSCNGLGCGVVFKLTP